MFPVDLNQILYNAILLLKYNMGLLFQARYKLKSDNTNIVVFVSYTAKSVNKGHSREPENVPCMSSCHLYTG
jgi:hypothetical protein